MRFALLLVSSLILPKWYVVPDGYRVHERYEIRYPDGSKQLVGEVYEVQPGDIRVQCAGDVRIYPVSTIEHGRGFVEDFCSK